MSTPAAAAPNHSLLKPSSASRPSSTSAPRSSSSAVAKPPLTAHPTAIIPDSAILQGTHHITIGAGTVIHPRAKLLSHDGPIVIGNGCIVGEKSTIGGPAPTSTSTSTTSTTPATPTPTTLEDNVLISPLATISSGSHIHDAATIDTSAFLGSHASIGAHSKVCSRCRIPDYGSVGDWIVVFGGVGDGGGGVGSSNNGFGVVGQRRRRRKVEGVNKGTDYQRESGEREGEREGGSAGAPGGSVMEDGRLVILGKEREVLGRLIGPAAGGMRRR